MRPNQPLPDFAAALETTLCREIPSCTGLTDIERLSAGASMETYRIGIVRSTGERYNICMRRGVGGIDRDANHATGLAIEAMAMAVARTAGVPEPEVLYVLRPDDGVGAGFLMEWLDGVTLGARVVRAPELDAIRPELAYQCGRELARIHGIDLTASGLADELRQVTPTEYLAETWQRYREFPTPQPMIDYTARWLSENVPADYTPALVHNDFRNGNLMFDPEKGLIAVLDWESAHIGDPMRDLGWICTNSWRFGRRDLSVGGFGQFADLVTGYEEQSGTRVDVDRVHYWEVFGSFWWAVGCLNMAEHYRTGLEATVERPAIGRRSSECQVDCVNLLIPGPVEMAMDLPAVAVDARGDMPTTDELIVSVRDFLRDEVMEATNARTSFLARVAGNTLDIVRRELLIAPELRRREAAALSELLATDMGSAVGPAEQGSAADPTEQVTEMRWKLVKCLRDGSMPLNQPGLAEYLRDSVVHQVAIDQPSYSGYRHAIAVPSDTTITVPSGTATEVASGTAIEVASGTATDSTDSSDA